MEKGKMETIIRNNDPFIQRFHKSPRLPSRTLFSFRSNISLKRTNVTNNKHDKKHDEMEEERGGGELTGVSLTTYSSHHRRHDDIFDIFALEKNVDPIDPVHNKHDSLDTCYSRARMRACACAIYNRKKREKGGGRGRKRERERERRGIETIRFRKLANQGSLVSSDVKAVCSKLFVPHTTTKGRRETRSPGWVDDKRPLDQVSGSSVTRLSNKTSSHGEVSYARRKLFVLLCRHARRSSRARARASFEIVIHFWRMARSRFYEARMDGLVLFLEA